MKKREKHPKQSVKLQRKLSDELRLVRFCAYIKGDYEMSVDTGNGQMS